MGFLGNALLGWEAGKKGFRRLGLEGPANRRVTFALASFGGMLVWQSLGKLRPALDDWRDLWAPLVAVAAFVLARALTPRSQRLFNRAKYLHETAFAGDWRKPPTAEDAFAAPTAYPRLQNAERLYHECLAIQERLKTTAERPADKESHQRNIIVAHTQLALLLMMMRRLPEAKARAQGAVQLARSLSPAPKKSANLAVLSEALFRLGQAEQLLGDPAAAVRHLQDALVIDERLGNSEGASHVRLLLQELPVAPGEAV